MARGAEALVVGAVDAGRAARPNDGSTGPRLGLPGRKLGEDVGIGFAAADLLNGRRGDAIAISEDVTGIGGGEDVAHLSGCEYRRAAGADGLGAGCACAPAVRAA